MLEEQIIRLEHFRLSIPLWFCTLSDRKRRNLYRSIYLVNLENLQTIWGHTFPFLFKTRPPSVSEPANGAGPSPGYLLNIDFFYFIWLGLTCLSFIASRFSPEVTVFFLGKIGQCFVIVSLTQFLLNKIHIEVWVSKTKT